MPLKVEKKGKESTWNLIRRFSQKIRRSGILVEARKKMFRQRPKSDKLKRRSALRREEKKKEFEKKQKMGEL